MADSVSMSSAFDSKSAPFSATPSSLSPDVSDRFADLGRRFEQAGAVGLVVIGAPMVADVERRHGDEARKRCLESLRDRVSGIAEERLRTNMWFA